MFDILIEHFNRVFVKKHYYSTYMRFIKLVKGCYF